MCTCACASSVSNPVLFRNDLASIVGCGGSVVGSVPCVRMVAGLNHTLAATWGLSASPSVVVACGTSEF